MPSWPSGIPQSPQVSGNSISLGENRISFGPDLGRPTYRRRFSVRDDVIAWSFQMTTAQFSTFTTWYKTTLGDGVTPFDYLDPTTGLTSKFQFRSPPQANFIKPFYYSVSLSLLRFGT